MKSEALTCANPANLASLHTNKKTHLKKVLFLHRFRGLSSLGLSFRGLSFIGVSFRGLSFPGVSFRGLSFLGLSFRGLRSQVLVF